jgi:hypothetical protein
MDKKDIPQNIEKINDNEFLEILNEVLKDYKKALINLKER